MTIAVRVSKHLDNDLFFTEEEGRALFESEIQRLLGISSEPFFQRWNAGEYRDTPDTPENWAIYHIAMVMPLGRSVPA